MNQSPKRILTQADMDDQFFEWIEQFTKEDIVGTWLKEWPEQMGEWWEVRYKGTWCGRCEFIVDSPTKLHWKDGRRDARKFGLWDGLCYDCFDEITTEEYYN